MTSSNNDNFIHPFRNYKRILYKFFYQSLFLIFFVYYGLPYLLSFNCIIFSSKNYRKPKRLTSPKILIALIVLVFLQISLLTLPSVSSFLLLIGLIRTSLLKFAFRKSHILLMLLTLEFITLLTFLCVRFRLFQLSSSIYFIFCFLTLAVCEARLGLCILVNLGRGKGNDLLPFYIFKLIKLKTFKVLNAKQNSNLV